MPDPSWGAIPEISTGRLQAGPGAAPMLTAAAAWTAKSLEYGEQAARWSALMAQAGTACQSTLISPMVEATATKLVGWYAANAANHAKAATAATAQAAAHTTAYTSVVQPSDIAANHTEWAALVSTNFLGMNTIPIAVNEADYMIRMPGQNSSVMAAYEATTMANLAGLQTVIPPVPLGMPGMAAASLGESAAMSAAGAPGAAARDGIFAAVAGTSLADNGAMQGGGIGSTIGTAVSQATGLGMATGLGAGQAGADATQTGADNALQQTLPQLMTSLPQMASQLPQQVGQELSQLSQAPMSAMQSMLGPLQSMLGGGMGTNGLPLTQIGLPGASPFTDHPLAGGTGAPAGAGLLSASGLGSGGGVAGQSPFLASLLAPPPSAQSARSVRDKQPATEHEEAEKSVARPDSVASRAGAAPAGGLMPASAATRRQNGQGRIKALVAPAPLVFANHAEYSDDWTT